MSGQIGPMIATRLRIPSSASAIKLEINGSERRIRVERELDAGHRCSMDLSLSALVAVQSGINRPHYPSLSNINILRAKNAEIKEIRYAPGLSMGKHETVQKVQEAGTDQAGIRLKGITAKKARYGDCPVRDPCYKEEQHALSQISQIPSLNTPR